MNRPKPSKDDGKPLELIFSNFKGGTITLADESRTPQTAVVTSTNHLLDEDGVWMPRPGSAPYGQPLAGSIDGTGTATTYIAGVRSTYLFVCAAGGLYYSQNGGAWTLVAGSAYSVGYKMQMLQVKSRLYIVNGKDTLSYVDLTNMSLVTYTSLATAGAPSLTLQTLTTGSFNNYYKITAVSIVGETAASAEATTTTNKQRANWATNGTESITLSWSAVTNAQRYNIYYSDQTGQEVFLDSVTGTSYIDNGRAVTNPYQQAPAFDGTSGPAIGRITLSGNRVWGTKDYNNLYRVWFTGTGKDLGSFNPYVGGGYVDLNLGSEEIPVDVQHYRDGKGTQQATILTTSPTGGGSVWFITLSTLTVGVVNVVIPNAVSQGSIGSSSPYGNVQAQNSIFYPSIKGFQTLGSSQAVFNVIVTNETSANIRPNVRAIKSSAANQICGIYYFGKIYYSVPYSSDTNNQIWILDLERQSWAIAWNIGVKQFIEYTDSSGVVHLLGVPVTGTQMIEFSNAFNGDSGVAFPLNLESGLIHFDQNHFTWAFVNKVYVELGRPVGNINFSVSGTTANKTLKSLKTLSITNTAATTGLGNDLFGDFRMGDTNGVPKTFSQSSIKKVILVNKKLNNIKWSISSSDINARYKVLEIGIIGEIRPSSDPGSWRK